MIKIGITGGIGSGKTTVCKMFEVLGIPVYYADYEARNILEYDKEVKKEVVNTFGKEVLTTEGNVDRKKLSTIVFNNKELLQKLNAIIHPAVKRHFEEWCTMHNSEKFVLKEAAIMFESGSDKQVDRVITVTAPLELKIARTINRDNITREQVLDRMKNQISDEEKLKRSWMEIMNDDEHLVIPQVTNIYNLLCK